MALAMNKRGPLTPQSGFLSYFEFWSKHRDFLLFLDKHDLLRLLSEKQNQLLYQNIRLQDAEIDQIGLVNACVGLGQHHPHA